MYFTLVPGHLFSLLYTTERDAVALLTISEKKRKKLGTVLRRKDSVQRRKQKKNGEKKYSQPATRGKKILEYWVGGPNFNNIGSDGDIDVDIEPTRRAEDREV